METCLARRRWRDMDPIRTYREKAAHLSFLAKSMTDAEIREQLEISAKDYDDIADEMADQIEGRSARRR